MGPVFALARMFQLLELRCDRIGAISYLLLTCGALVFLANNFALLKSSPEFLFMYDRTLAIEHLAFLNQGRALCLHAFSVICSVATIKWRVPYVHDMRYCMCLRSGTRVSDFINVVFAWTITSLKSAEKVTMTLLKLIA
jgi:hypothetical protein